MIAACKDDQITIDDNIPGFGYTGICTYNFKQAIGDGKKPTYKEMLLSMRNHSKPGEYMVQLSTNFELDMNLPFTF